MINGVNETMTENLIPNEVADILPATVKQALLKMDDATQHSFLEEFKRKRKSTGKAYMFLLLGYFHNIYIGRGVGMWLLQIVLIAAAGAGLIWAIVDAFKMPTIIRNLNADIAKDIIRDIKIINT
jgi:hypothetical protein